MKGWRIGVVAIVVLAIVAVFLFKQKPSSQTVEENSQNEESAKPVLVELGSHGCKACEAMKPVLAQLEENFGDRLTVKFYDVKSEPEIAREYGIRVIPTQIFKNDKGEEIFRHEGYYTQEEILKVFRDRNLIQ